MTTWYALRVRVPPPAAEAVLGWAWEDDISGVLEDDADPGTLTVYARRPWDVDRARVEIARRLAFLGEGAPPDVTALSFPEEDWQAEWKRTWRPTPLGTRLLVAPSWWAEPLPADRIVLRLDPGPAFGTGTHVTTALAWELLEPCLPVRRLLDVGAGSGILFLGALLLCHELRAVATEADPHAALALAANAARTGCGERVLPLRTRGVPCRAGAFDLAVANLTAAEHAVVAGDLARAPAPGGRVVLSGLRDADPTHNIWTDNGFRCEARAGRDGWRAERWRRPGE